MSPNSVEIYKFKGLYYRDQGMFMCHHHYHHYYHHHIIIITIIIIIIHYIIVGSFDQSLIAYSQANSIEKDVESFEGGYHCHYQYKHHHLHHHHH